MSGNMLATLSRADLCTSRYRRGGAMDSNGYRGTPPFLAGSRVGSAWRNGRRFMALVTCGVVWVSTAAYGAMVPSPNGSAWTIPLRYGADITPVPGGGVIAN